MDSLTKKTDAVFEKIQESLHLYFRMVTQASYSFEPNISLTITECYMLSRIAKLEVATVTKLAKEIGITKGGVSTLISKLEKKQLVLKKPDETHGSRILISVTTKGKEIIATREGMHDKNNAPFINYLHNLSPEEFDTVVTFAEQMHQWVDLFQKDHTLEGSDNE